MWSILKKTMIFFIITIILSGCWPNVERNKKNLFRIDNFQVKITQYPLPEGFFRPLWIGGTTVFAQQGQDYPKKFISLYESKDLKNYNLVVQFPNQFGQFFINPKNNKEIYFISYTGEQGVYKSKDGGKWHKIFQGKVEKIIFDPKSPDTYYLIQNKEPIGVKVYISRDGGEHWNFKFSVQEIFYATQLFINPLNEKQIYITARNGLWESLDGGKHWQNVFLDGEPRGIAFDPVDLKNLYFIDGRGLYRLREGKIEEVKLPAIHQEEEILGIIGRDDTKKIFVLTLKEINKSHYEISLYQIYENKAKIVASLEHSERILEEIIFDSENPNNLYIFSYKNLFKITLK
ncbi:WD40/YVTN/BNR-like repeat-containing protein [Carboxydothermus hydrogenoformans]|uniref:Putative lipoprotein n=1 Tax=Carboxydothermus hydrogenoformans (strain ATCC BAA-161 / DSM 6008 / Z-2901) TaxID=246194 RepID=Q3AAX4_CARHZ|nr:lipoprotein [Carboxydothermus hydrogenoformans]ABB16173.1 putative lipoprotein [Carboxydothermus hydrogenoformans Z-2901]